MEFVENPRHGFCDDFDPAVIDDFCELCVIAERVEVSGFFWSDVYVEFDGLCRISSDREGDVYGAS